MYALLFADTGLSAAQISSLFVVWSVTSFVLEVPSGLWADTFSRRRLLTVAPLLTGAGYALWTFLPSYPAFALGFVLWGAGGALRSGTLQALVYEELARAGASDGYARLIGRSQAVGTTAVLLATALAAPVLAAGGYPAVGIASIAATLAGALAGWALPESRGGSERAGSYSEVFRDGLAEVRESPGVRGALVLVAVLTGVWGALDEYLPLLARATGVGAATVPLLVLLVAVGNVAGGWLAGRGTRWTAPALAAAALCLAVGAGSGHPAGMVLVAVAFGVFEWSGAAADARLQARVADRARATVTSMAGFGSEVVAVLTYAAYALGSVWTSPGPLFAVAAVPYLVMALLLRGRRPGRS
ncbi:MFS transporter [Actinorugispora endophytica]|uniref:Putative MFS family arabinose efflux permease n=1 Tax=Actinorugispora endophytica TaxID=1605990 RepID=A0A4R6V3I5_9ACTN|nr:MFS transporter [Actinorugispora endophytica]TDQ53311.1 putative MFS family arabinose efflux permease [Actinorugispora endophytica]